MDATEAYVLKGQDEEITSASQECRFLPKHESHRVVHWLLGGTGVDVKATYHLRRAPQTLDWVEDFDCLPMAGLVSSQRVPCTLTTCRAQASLALHLLHVPYQRNFWCFQPIDATGSLY